MDELLRKELQQEQPADAREEHRLYSYEPTLLGRYRRSSVESTEEEDKNQTEKEERQEEEENLSTLGEFYPVSPAQTAESFDDAAFTTRRKSSTLFSKGQDILPKKRVKFLHKEPLHEVKVDDPTITTAQQTTPESSRVEGARATSHKILHFMDKTLKHWIKRFQTKLSWKTIRLMLIDWLFLAILGIGMALLSMFMDNVIEWMQSFQVYLMRQSAQTGHPVLDYLCTYLSWLLYTQALVICSAVFVHYVAPQAIGSGIPEMKTVLRGVVLKDYLSARTLLSKIVGLTLSLGSRIPIGKMGPFVHVAACTANLLSSVAARFEGAYGNECRRSEMLAAACATGVACTFSAPIGGVLLSIELTTMYFSVPNYWRGFFAAACGATVFRLLRVYAFKEEVTLVAFYQTRIPENAFVPMELPFFALIGLMCGFFGAAFNLFYKRLVIFLRTNQTLKRMLMLERSWLTYPLLVSFLVATITYPRGFGRFLSEHYKFTRTVLDFFSNCTWSKPMEAHHSCSPELIFHWTNHDGYGPYNVFLVLSLFVFTFVFLSALCNTMPIPCGMFMPMFVVGGAFGRLCGEIVASIYPQGIPNDAGIEQPIFPGIYAVVGAAALTGAITHSVSVAMICCEITGQLIYLIPLMISVIIANAVCTYLQPSIYDVMIGIKNLPYLPDIPPSNADVHLATADDIMVSDVHYLCRITTYMHIKDLLIRMQKIRSFPVVDDACSMLLVGSISRRTLVDILNRQIGNYARQSEAAGRIREAIETIDRHFREAQAQMLSSQLMGAASSEPQSIRESGQCTPLVNEYYSKCAENESENWNSQQSFAKSDLKKSSSYDSIDLNPVTKLDLPCVKPVRQNRLDEVRTPDESPSRFSIKEKKRKLTASLSFTKMMKHEAASQTPVVRRRNAFASVALQGHLNSSSDIEEAAFDRTTDASLVSSSTAGISEKKFPQSIQNPFAKTSAKNAESAGQQQRNYDYQNINTLTRNIHEYVQFAKKHLQKVQHKRQKDSTEKAEYDLFDNERYQWEYQRLSELVEIDGESIDPAPFQLVPKTSVFKVHSLFSLLSLNRAYVTDRGRLVGIVALRDLRLAIQNSQNGIPVKNCRSARTSVASSSPVLSNSHENVNISTSNSKTDLKEAQNQPTISKEQLGSTSSIQRPSSLFLPDIYVKDGDEEVSEYQGDKEAEEIFQIISSDRIGTPLSKLVVIPADDEEKATSSSSFSSANYPNFNGDEKKRRFSTLSFVSSVSRRLSQTTKRRASLAPPPVVWLPPAAQGLPENEENDKSSQKQLLPELPPSLDALASAGLELEVAQAVAYLRRKSLALEVIETSHTLNEQNNNKNDDEA